MIYYYPNRPFLLSPSDPTVEEKSLDPAWHAEVKYNGDRLVLFYEAGKFHFFNRTKGEFKKYVPPKSVLDELYSLNLPDKCQLDGELLNFKTKDTKNKIIFYDLYVLGGEQQFGTLKERQDKLNSFLEVKKFVHISMVERHPTNFREMFDKVTAGTVLYEGLVMKNDFGKIVWDTVKSPDVTWQLKIRRPNKNYKF